KTQVRLQSSPAGSLDRSRMTMMFSMLEMPIRCRRDVIWAQQRMRRLAVLLRYDSHDQALIAACAFTVANHALEALGHAELCVPLGSCFLHVFAQPLSAQPPGKSRAKVSDQIEQTESHAPLMRLSKELPGKHEIPTEDVGWIATQLPLLEKLDVFE